VLNRGSREFPPFRLDPVNQCLWRRWDSGDEERILVTPKAFAVLSYLVDHAGRLVTQEDLLAAVWPNTFVQPEVLKRHIFLLRDVLGDEAKSPHFIETLPRRGYQFIAGVRDTAAAKPAADTSMRSKLVGRDRALGELRAYLERASGGQRQTVFVTGEPGIGKTTLVDEFQRRAGTGAPLSIARGQCVEGFGGKEAYYPMLEALGNLCRDSAGNTVIQILAAQAPTWLVQFPSLVKREQRETLQREILGATRERMLREIADALETIASEVPLLLLLEDLHWVDHSTVDLISALSRGRGPAKLLFVGTYRPVDIALSEHPLKLVKRDLLAHQLCYEIALQPLAETEIAAYLSGVSREANPPKGFAALLHQHSEGNPLFMVAALDHMIQRGLISHRDGSWKLNVPLEAIELEAPENLRAMIETQIERLSGEEQRALEVASVTGVTFTAKVNATAAMLDEEKFEDLCEELSRRQHMVRSAGSHTFPDGSVSRRYEFAHALYREVFYIRQARGRRARLHLRIGERLEKLYSTHENEVAAELAEHFEEASDWLRAVRYLHTAADSARRRYAHEEAIAILKHAAGLSNRLPESERTTNEMEVLEQLAMFYVARFKVRAALETYEKLIALAARQGVIDVEIRALLHMALPACWTSAQLFIETVDRALQLSTSQEDPFLRARTRARCFACRAVAGRWRPEDAESGRKEMEEIERKGDRLITAEHRLEYTRMQLLLSQYGEAHRSGVDSLAILLDQDDLNPYFGVLYLSHRFEVLVTLLLWGKWGQALKEVAAQTAFCEKNGDYARGQEVLIQAAWVHLYAMDYSGVMAICESIFASIALPPSVRHLHVLIGSAEASLGNHDRARDHLLNVKDDLDRHPLMDNWLQSMPLQAGLVELWLSKGDLAQARQEAERFLDLALATAERTYQGLAWEANARVAIAEQEWQRGEECIAKGLSTIAGYEVPIATWRVHGTAAELHARAGKSDLAEHHRELSRATIMKLANSLEPEEPLRATFLSAPPVRRILDYTDRIGV
jgi:DNA-binding winged helix-turn-helix (wHTH) protein/tetratricopeptide (TPR) repeat protein